MPCGEVVSTVLLECALAGFATCPLTHLTEMPRSRAIVRELTVHSGLPQVLIRAGIAPEAAEQTPETPRRPLTEILDMRVPETSVPQYTGAQAVGLLDAEHLPAGEPRRCTLTATAAHPPIARDRIERPLRGTEDCVSRQQATSGVGSVECGCLGDQRPCRAGGRPVSEGCRLGEDSRDDHPR